MALPNGELVCFRPVCADDRQILAQGMSSLSAQSRLFRFFSPISCLSSEQLRYFTEVDQHDHVAWIAVSKNQAEQTGLGIARFIRSMQQPGVAEFAMVVLDSYQNRGLGSIFMSLLYKLAHSKNIEILQAAVLSENTVMSTWLSRLGAVGTFDNGSYRMDLKISTELSTLASTSLQRVHFYVNHLDEAFQPRPEGV